MEMKKKFIKEIDQLFCDFSIYDTIMKKHGRLLHQNKRLPIFFIYKKIYKYLGFLFLLIVKMFPPFSKIKITKFIFRIYLKVAIF